MPFSYYNRSHAEILPFDVFSDRKIIMEKIKGKSVLWLAYPPNYPLNYDLELEKFLNRHCSINKMFLSKRAIPANVLKLTVYENIFK